MIFFKIFFFLSPQYLGFGAGPPPRKEAQGAVNAVGGGAVLPGGAEDSLSDSEKEQRTKDRLVMNTEARDLIDYGMIPVSEKKKLLRKYLKLLFLIIK